ncbi:hypothetical protein [Fimbriiglobus ruber]|uniref:hypothetical protein n=1 Tax=Fimbriiglobus ruber TaxID=1908690 RepID=UPI00117B77A1|nr:hypothetical protein [Fimbriiglobus ruber]
MATSLLQYFCIFSDVLLGSLHDRIGVGDRADQLDYDPRIDLATAALKRSDVYVSSSGMGKETKAARVAATAKMKTKLESLSK